MTRMKLNFSILGVGFDAINFHAECGLIEGGRVNMGLTPSISSIIPGGKIPFNQWSLKHRLYKLSEISEESIAGSWVEEEAVILSYLNDVLNQLPIADRYSNGEIYKILTVVYLESDERPIGGFFFSPKLYKELARMGLYMDLICRPEVN